MALVGATRNLLNVIEHRGVLDEVPHHDAGVRVSHRELDAFESQLSVSDLKSWIIVLHHHEGVGPELYEVQQHFFDLVPALLDIF